MHIVVSIESTTWPRLPQTLPLRHRLHGWVLIASLRATSDPIFFVISTGRASLRVEARAEHPVAVVATVDNMMSTNIAMHYLQKLKFETVTADVHKTHQKKEHPFGRCRVAGLGSVVLALGAGFCLGNDKTEEPLTDHSDRC